ncbi:hypothetical protein V1264_010228 [Littorina saxatilis]|uniref:Muscleblind-like CCCH zinc finger domain-containing protein n=1 Tax=Littorina saxatilis TaxID=31220 RepID=A0AAN9APA2_9CAEN
MLTFHVPLLVLQGKCQRKDPPCKYLHPPQHLREQLLQNGRNNLILKSLHLQAALHHPQVVPGLIPMAGGKPMAYPTAVMPGQIPYVAGPHYLSSVPTSAVHQYSPYGLPTVTMPGGDGTMVTQQMQGVISTPIPTKTRPDRLEPQVVEVLTASKKRPRDPAEELVLPQQMLVPPYKRMAIDGSLGKSGIPMYQPTIQTSPYQQATLMHLQQQPYIPVTYSGEVMSQAYANYLPQVTGHPPTVPRF